MEIFIGHFALQSQISKNAVLKRSLLNKADRQNVTLRIVKKTSFARKESYRFIATTRFSFPRRDGNKLHAKLPCVAKRRPTLAVFLLVD